MNDTERSRDRIRALLAERGWSARELSRRADISASTAAAAKRGETEKLLDKNRRRIAEALGWPDWGTMMATDAMEPPAEAADAPNADEVVRLYSVMEQALDVVKAAMERLAKAERPPVTTARRGNDNPYSGALAAAIFDATLTVPTPAFA